MSKPVSFYSEGIKLAGDLFLPADVKPGDRRAGIVLCHGYTGVRSIYLPDNARVLAEAGYVVMSFDYKDWGDSEGPKSRHTQGTGFGYRAGVTGQGFSSKINDELTLPVPGSIWFRPARRRNRAG